MTQSEATLQTINQRYRILEKLGEGGMGAVYRAFDRLTGQTVALKLVSTTHSDSLDDSIDYRLTLTNEFKVLATLRHPHVISVLDYGFDGEQRPYFTMELVEGSKTFLDAAKNAQLLDKINRLIELLQAVAYLHRRNILHRDLKPGNVLITLEGVLKVVDFGLATDEAHTDELAGTLAYIAPELLQGLEISPASDLYAIGVMAYELFTGFHPYHQALNSGMAALISALLSQTPNLEPLYPLDSVDENTSSRIQYVHSGEDDVTAIYSETMLDIRPADRVDETAILGSGGDYSEEDDELDSTRFLDVTEARYDSVSRSANNISYGSGFSDEELARPDTMSGVIGKLLEKSPVERYSDAYRVIDDLCAALSVEAPQESAAIRESFLQAATFVGRDSELQQLEDALERAIDGQGSAWLIGGESGIGKSRLLDELRIRALVRGVLVLRGTGVVGGGLSYQLWREPLRRLLLTTDIDDLDAGILKDIVLDIEQLLDRAIQDPAVLEGAEYQQRLLGTITSLFQHQNQPIVLLLEDLQWLNESLDVLKVLCSMVESLPILIVGSYRHEERPELHKELEAMKVMRLERLDYESIERLSQSIIGHSNARQEINNFLLQETGGNVFFIVEVLRTLAQSAGRLDQIGISVLPKTIFPDGIQSVVSRRLDNFVGKDRELLEQAAIIGREIDLKILKHLDPGADINDWLVTATNFAVIEILDERWQFSNSKIRDATLNMLAPARFKELHARVAEAILDVYADMEDKFGTVADHWHDAENFPMECRYSQLAGLHALKISVFHEAKRYFERVLELIDDLPSDFSLLFSKPQIQIRLSEVLQHLGNYDDASILAEAALRGFEASNDRNGAAIAMGLLGDISWHLGNYADGIDWSERSLELCEALGYRLGIARAHNRIGMIRWQQGNYDLATEFFEKSRSIVEPLDAKGELAGVLNNIGLVMYAQGKFENAMTYFNNTVTLSRQTGERSRAAGALLNLGSIAGMRGKLDEARTYFEECLTISREIGNRRFLALALNNLGMLAFLTGDLKNAESYYEESGPISESIGNRAQYALTLCNLGNVHRMAGTTDKAFQYYYNALMIAYDSDSLATAMEVLVGMAQIASSATETLKLCKVVIEHPATFEDIRQEAQVLQEEASTNLSKQELARIHKEIAQADIESIMNEFIARHQGND